MSLSSRANRLIFSIVATLSASIFPAISGDFPDRPIQVIVPFGAGGNSDTIARVIQRVAAEHELLPQPLVIQNVPGAGGTIGSRRALHAEPDGYTLLFLHEGIITARYSGAASWSWNDFTPIAATGRNGGVIAVAEDSRFQNLNDLLMAIAENPDTVTFATNIGAPAHFWAMRLENTKPGARFRYVQSGGGAARFHSLKGGHVEATAFSVSEFLSYRDGGLRALAVLAENRDPVLSEIPTAREQGIDVVSSNLQCWWAPKGTSPENIAVIANALEAAMHTTEFREFADSQQIEPLFLSGPELETELSNREAEIAQVAPRAIAGLPNVPLFLAILTVTAGIGSFVVRPATQQGMVADSTLLRRRSVALVILTIGYVAILALVPIPFLWPTFVFLLLAGALLRDQRHSKSAMAAFVGFSALIAFGLPRLFESVFGISLP
ncbi:MAG: tripartite tricarboxylate transporter substrate binding protein [Verrucomicrobiae bacterium]|nr:tripartite tricarboxylate transporter substrate binding protein [Verrucomicrobiae bacterium]